MEDERTHTTGQPTPEQVAAKAYEMFEARGRGDGLATQDWLEAERLLREELAGAEAEARALAVASPSSLTRRPASPLAKARATTGAAPRVAADGQQQLR